MLKIAIVQLSSSEVPTPGGVVTTCLNLAKSLRVLSGQEATAICFVDDIPGWATKTASSQ